MQTEEGLFRVASEAAQDLAADGVVYAEIRYAPEQHLQRGLTLEQVVEAVNDGFREGERLAREAGHGIRVTALLTAMRHAAKSREIAELGGALPRRRGGRVRHRRRGGGVPARPVTSTRSSSSVARTPTSRSTPARRSG